MTPQSPAYPSDDLDDAPSLIRPYSWTYGRTKPAVDLAIEALVQTTSQGGAVPYNRANPQSAVTQLCRQPCSVAEIAARMSLPLGVARVLVGDLLGTGLVQVRETLGDEASWDERRELLERVLSGLHAL
jgi:predicted ArsR family transcriptional regulator